VLRAHFDAAIVKDVGRGWRLTKRPPGQAQAVKVRRPNDLSVAASMAVARLEGGADALPDFL
jgi:hypothetical protein